VGALHRKSNAVVTKAAHSDGNGTLYRVFLDRHHDQRLLDQFECGGLVSEAHIGQREIAIVASNLVSQPTTTEGGFMPNSTRLC
jgi:hypothetical protein